MSRQCRGPARGSRLKVRLVSGGGGKLTLAVIGSGKSPAFNLVGEDLEYVREGPAVSKGPVHGDGFFELRRVLHPPLAVYIMLSVIVWQRDVGFDQFRFGFLDLTWLMTSRSCAAALRPLLRGKVGERTEVESKRKEVFHMASEMKAGSHTAQTGRNHILYIIQCIYTQVRGLLERVIPGGGEVGSSPRMDSTWAALAAAAAWVAGPGPARGD